MEPEHQQSEKVGAKLYVYGGRESDQFWLPDGRSYSRKPFCLSNIQEFQFDEEDQNQNDQKIIPNPLFNRQIYKIACGGLHSIVLTTDGEVYTFGCNDEGALGRQGIQCIPIKVELQDPIDMISAGDNHSLFANSVNGAIYTTGNYNYLRGEKMKEQSIRKPQRIYAQQINISNKNKRIQKIASGANHNCVLVGGKVFCRGQPEALTIGRRSSKRHKVDNSLTFNGVNLSNIVDIECGGYHTVVKVEKKQGFQYYSWGTNTSGQLGIGSYQSQAYPVEIKKLKHKNIKQIAAGTNFTLFLTEEGEVLGCGTNEYGSLGLGQDYKYEDSDFQEEEEEGKRSDEDLGQLEEKVKDNLNLDIMDEKPKEPQEQQNQQPLEKLKQIVEKNLEQSEKKKEQDDEIQPQERPKLNLQQNVYIKSVRKIQTPQPITHLAGGSEFALAWNEENLYTWGFGTGYVLLNGSEEQQYKPFKVKSTIINEHRMHELSAGGQHVMYISHPKDETVEIKQADTVWENLTSCRKLKKKK